VSRGGARFSKKIPPASVCRAGYHRIGNKILGDLAAPESLEDSVAAWAHPGILHSYASTPGAYDLNVGPCQNLGGADAFSKGPGRSLCIYLLGADFDPG